MGLVFSLFKKDGDPEIRWIPNVRVGVSDDDDDDDDDEYELLQLRVPGL